MIYNVAAENFGCLRMGDIIALANVVEHFRQSENNANIKFHLLENSTQPDNYVQEFRQWMTENTDYFSLNSGEVGIPWLRVNLWDYRDISGDLVKISNPYQLENKIVIAPLFDAAYNQYRNWPKSVYDNIINHVNEKYPTWDKVIVHKNLTGDSGFRASHNLTSSLHEIMTAKVYFGGDTGLSHFVGALEHGPDPIYYTSSRGLLHTTPFNWIEKKKGTIKTYWLDFERTIW